MLIILLSFVLFQLVIQYLHKLPSLLLLCKLHIVVSMLVDKLDYILVMLEVCKLSAVDEVIEGKVLTTFRNQYYAIFK